MCTSIRCCYKPARSWQPSRALPDLSQTPFVAIFHTEYLTCEADKMEAPSVGRIGVRLDQLHALPVIFNLNSIASRGFRLA